MPYRRQYSLKELEAFYHKEHNAAKRTSQASDSSENELSFPKLNQTKSNIHTTSNSIEQLTTTTFLPVINDNNNTTEKSTTKTAVKKMVNFCKTSKNKIF